ncbi:MAG: hypothetical protein KDA75_01990 [Planctomycetaceae bacterium]|nr:hypothetical protein [Planctomycetaceae bacterium]
MPHYVILTHDHPFPHWDLLLETGEACRTWRLLGEPGCNREIAAEPLPDHRLLYLDYEGPVSGDRGSVERWDRGTYIIVSETADSLVVLLDGERGLGRGCLSRAGGGECWQFQASEFDSSREVNRPRDGG